MAIWNSFWGGICCCCLKSDTIQLFIGGDSLLSEDSRLWLALRNTVMFLIEMTNVGTARGIRGWYIMQVQRINWLVRVFNDPITVLHNLTPWNLHGTQTILIVVQIHELLVGLSHHEKPLTSLGFHVYAGSWAHIERDLRGCSLLQNICPREWTLLKL